MCDPDESRGDLVSQVPPPSQSKEHSGFQRLGRLPVVSRDRSGGWRGGRRWAQVGSRTGTKTCSAMLCCVVLVLEPLQSQSPSQSQSAVAVAGEEGEV